MVASFSCRRIGLLQLAPNAVVLVSTCSFALVSSIFYSASRCFDPIVMNPATSAAGRNGSPTTATRKSANGRLRTRKSPAVSASSSGPVPARTSVASPNPVPAPVGVAQKKTTTIVRVARAPGSTTALPVVPAAVGVVNDEIRPPTVSRGEDRLQLIVPVPATTNHPAVPPLPAASAWTVPPAKLVSLVSSIVPRTLASVTTAARAYDPANGSWRKQRRQLDHGSSTPAAPSVFVKSEGPIVAPGRGTIWGREEERQHRLPEQQPVYVERQHRLDELRQHYEDCNQSWSPNRSEGSLDGCSDDSRSSRGYFRRSRSLHRRRHHALRTSFGSVETAEQARSKLRFRKRRPEETLQALQADIRMTLEIGYPGVPPVVLEDLGKEASLGSLDQGLHDRIRDRGAETLDEAAFVRVDAR